MPSEPGPAPAAGPASRAEWLFSQGLGLICGQSTVLLLAVGSIVLSATRDGASAAIGMDDLRGFFEAPALAHLWLYLLIPVLGLYGLNTLLATWRNVLGKWRNGVRLPQAYAPAVIHLAFLVGLLAHLVGGFGSREHAPLVVGPDWQDLGDGRRARLSSLDVERLPDGSTRQVWARLELEGAAGRGAATVHYNGPLSTGLGSDLFLLARPLRLPGPVRLVRGGGAPCLLEVDERCELDGASVELLYLQHPSRPGEGTLARVRVRGAAPLGQRDFWLAEGRPQELADGSQLVLAGVESRPGILLQRREAPGTPWALLAAVLLALGLALMGRRFLRTGSFVARAAPP